MAIKRKAIVRAGVYNVPTESGHTRTEVIYPERLRHWADTFHRMKQAGHKIPAPFSHHPQALPIQMGQDGVVPTSFDNAGFWENMEVANDDDGVPTLFGDLDTPGDESDPRTPAWKVGNTVKETSIYARPLFVDGKGKAWEDALMHIACVVHAVEPGQSNFTSVPKGSLSLAMSQCAYAIQMGLPSGSPSNATQPSNQLSDPSAVPNEDPEGQQIRSGSDIKTVIENLRIVAKLVLPDDTSEDNLLERLNAALLQKHHSESEDRVEDGVTRRAPPGAIEQQPPIVMSFSPRQIDALLQTKAVNPDTGRPYTRQELEAVGQPATQMSQAPTPPAPPTPDITTHPEYQRLQQATGFLMSQTQNQARQVRQSRIDNLVRTGRVSQTYVDQHLKPLLDGFQMSFRQAETGQLVENPHPIDATLAALEAQPALTQPVLGSANRGRGISNIAEVLNALVMGQGGIDIQGLQDATNPYEAGISDEDADKLAEQIINS